MPKWYSGPIGTMWVFNGQGESPTANFASALFKAGVPVSQVVTNPNIDFDVWVQYDDHPLVGHGRGYFQVDLFKWSGNTWLLIDSQSETLGTDNDSGQWGDWITVSVKMAEIVEQYQIRLYCETQDVTISHNDQAFFYPNAIQSFDYLGDFTLDFIPLSIVYSPPGQDMTASLTQSEAFGTIFNVGQGSGMQSQTGVHATIDILGIVGEGIGYSWSQAFSSNSNSGIRISHFRNSVVTADNQRTVGRAYWGPLGDIFVILVNPRFEVTRQATKLFYCLKTIRQVLLVPAWKLLRPGDDDPIASAIPADSRRRLLELDPFIRNLNLFFPDSGADLALVANPYADPSPNNRAEIIGRWWPDTGTEIMYSAGDTFQLVSGQAEETKYSSGLNINASVGANYDGIKAALGLDSSGRTTVSFQSSQETQKSLSRSASCLLLRSQNARDLDGIEVYYDKVFSSFMFRRIRGSTKDVRWGVVQGTASGRDLARLRALEVTLTSRAGEVFRTMTNANGEFSFYNVPPGKYTWRAGDQHGSTEVSDDSSLVRPQEMRLTGVRRLLNLRTASAWQVAEALRLPLDVVRALGRRLRRGGDLARVAELTSTDEATRQRWIETCVITAPKGRRVLRKRAKSRRRSR